LDSGREREGGEKREREREAERESKKILFPPSPLAPSHVMPRRNTYL
jgi:hypothetical protein